MIFAYNGFDKNGTKIRSKIEAYDIEEAKSKLRAKGIIYSTIKKESKPIFRNFSLKRASTISYKKLSTISRDLSIYIRSGISVVNAVKLAANQYKDDKKTTLFFKSIEEFLNEGKNFYQALEAQNVYQLPTFYKQSIKVSQNGGILDKVLYELSLFLKEQDRIDKQIVSSLAYPIFILLTSIFVVSFMLGYIVPKITSIFKELNQQLPTVTKIVIESGKFLSNNWLYLIALLFAIYLIFLFFKKSFPPFALTIDKLKLKIPIMGSIMYKNEMGRFSYVSYVLLSSGVPFAKTINLSSNILNNLYLKKIFGEASKKVVEGDRLSNALYKVSKDIDPSFLQAISLGEETSNTTEILKNLSELYFEENKDKTTLLLSLLEPALMLFVGGIVGFIITAMLLPIFSINIGAQ